MNSSEPGGDGIRDFRLKNKIALIGCGIWGKNILQELVYLDAEVHVFDKDPQLKDSVVENGARGYETGLPTQEGDFDGVIIATPTGTHRKILEKITELNVPFFLEKPLTNNIEDALALKNLPHQNIFLMHIWLYHPGILMLKEIAQSGELGEVHGVRSTRANWTSPRKDTDSVWNLSPHDITIAKAILGYIPTPKSAIAEKHNGVIRGFTGLMGNKPYCIFEVSNRFERKIREVRLHCKDGIAVLEDEKVDYIKIIHGDANSDLENENIEYRTFDKTPPLRIELEDFLNYLNGGAPPISDFSEGIEVIKTIHNLIELSN